VLSASAALDTGASRQRACEIGCAGCIDAEPARPTAYSQAGALLPVSASIDSWVVFRASRRPCSRAAAISCREPGRVGETQINLPAESAKTRTSGRGTCVPQVVRAVLLGGHADRRPARQPGWKGSLAGHTKKCVEAKSVTRCWSSPHCIEPGVCPRCGRHLYTTTVIGRPDKVDTEGDPSRGWRVRRRGCAWL
jgi:hypothetical protein